MIPPSPLGGFPQGVAMMDFCPHYQSIHLLQEGSGDQVFGWEALMRGPKGTPLESPISLFKRARLLNRLPDIDIQALQLSAQTFASNDPGGNLFVNLFPETILCRDFSETFILRMLKKIGLAPSRLVLEVLEPSADPEAIAEKLWGFKRHGISLALDDFGAGESGLKRWLVIEPDYVKCDRSITEGIAHSERKQRALQSVQALDDGKTRLLAEGVIDAEDVEYLRRHTTIRLVQSFFFSHPEPLRLPERKVACAGE